RHLRVFDGTDAVAGLEPEALRGRSVGDVNDPPPLRRGIEPQALRKRRREVGYLGTLERRPRSDDKFLVRRLRGGLERDVDRELLAGPHNAKPRMTADRLGSEAVVERIGVIDRLPIDSGDEAAVLEARLRCGAGRRDARHQRAGRALDPETFGDLWRDRLQPRAQPRTLDRGAPAFRRSDDDLHHVRRNGEADAL